MKKILNTIISGAFAMLLFSPAAIAQKGDSVEYDTKQIKFSRGKTSAIVRGLIKDRFESKSYYVSARAGQILTLTFNSPRKDIDVCLFLANETDICGRRKYSVKLDLDGDYIIMVDGHRENIPFAFTVSIK